jgi:hypothetical protein
LIELVLTSLLFILIGLSRGDVLDRLAGRGAAQLAEAALTKLSWELDFEENRGRRALG